jgi:sugar phosphate isomerase/epimerase
VRIGVFDDGLGHLGRQDALAWCAARGLEAIEMGVGGWGQGHHLDLDALLREASERDRLLGELADHGLTLSCVNAAGNPLHPDRTVGDDHAARLRGAVELAALLGVDRVVAMSGSPGAPGGSSLGIFASWALNPDFEELAAWQREHAVAPFWRELSAWAAEAAPDVVVCLELHPGCFAYSPATFLDLRAATGPNIGVNLDPSHFWWQGIDPVEAIGALAGHIGFAHAKDTLVHEDRVRRLGVFDVRTPIDPSTAPWTFAAVGRGHDDAAWAAIVDALRRAGHDGDLSIEHEDPTMESEAGIEASLDTVRRVVGARAGA